MADLTYRMLTNGSTYGAVTRRFRTWLPGQHVTAPAGEFRHLPDADYKILGQETATAKAPERAVARNKRKK